MHLQIDPPDFRRIMDLPFVPWISNLQAFGQKWTAGQFWEINKTARRLQCKF